MSSKPPTDHTSEETYSFSSSMARLGPNVGQLTSDAMPAMKLHDPTVTTSLAVNT